MLMTVLVCITGVFSIHVDAKVGGITVAIAGRR